MENTDYIGTVILCVASSDSHVVANKLIEKLLTVKKFKVLNLGACTDIHEIGQLYEKNTDVLCIAIGSLNGHAISDTEGFPLIKKRYKIKCPIAIGGNLSVGSKKCSSIEKKLKDNGCNYILKDPEDLIKLLYNHLRSNKSELKKINY